MQITKKRENVKWYSKSFIDKYKIKRTNLGDLPDPRGRKSLPTTLSSTEDLPEL